MSLMFGGFAAIMESIGVGKAILALIAMMPVTAIFLLIYMKNR